jgi:crotonobetaine/carnitine-CoA ligase
VEVRLIGPDGSDVADGDPGELILRPEDPSVITPGYINDAEATAAVLRGDWYHSGDLLRRDKQGLYYFVDRIKDSIRRRGENISSVEVELAVQTHPEVLDCAAIGVGGAVEQEVLAVVVRTESATLTEAELVTYLLSRLPYYAVPRYVAFMTQLPRTQTGKIQKAALRAMEMNPWDREEAGIKVSRPTRPSASPR